MVYRKAFLRTGSTADLDFELEVALGPDVASNLGISRRGTPGGGLEEELEPPDMMTLDFFLYSRII